MSHANRLKREDKAIVILTIIFLLILAAYFIYKLLGINEEKKQEADESYRYRYELIVENNRYSIYKLLPYDYGFDLTFDKAFIKLNRKKLSIDGIDIISNVKVFDYIAFYGVNVLLVVQDVSTGINSIVLFNLAKLEPQIIDKIDGMYIIDPEDINISEAGVNIHLSSYFNNVLHVDGKEYNICDYSKNIEVYKNLIYFYDYLKDDFTSFDVIETKKLDKYKKGIC